MMADHDDSQRLRLIDMVAYLDGELDDRAAQTVEAQLNRDPTARQQIESLRKTWDLLDYLPRPEPSADFTHRTMERLEILTGSRLTASRLVLASPPRINRWRSAWLTATAAGLAFVLGYAFGERLLPLRMPPPQPMHDEPLAQVDERFMDQIPLYAHIDDVDFLKALDRPEFFGEDRFGR